MQRKRAWKRDHPAFLLFLLAGGCGGPRLALTPLPQQDDDRYSISQPAGRERDDYYDVLDYTVFYQTGRLFDFPRHGRSLAGKPKQALNVTPLDEVLDSTWFTNRIGTRDLDEEAVRRGPNEPQGPDLRGPWRIVRAKTQGVTPGFTIEDPRGQRFVIKFDPASDPELATGAEAISTRLFWAMGYNVPQNYLVRFDASILQIGSEATVRQKGKKRAMTNADLEVILAKVPRNPDGSLRAIASRYIEGTPLGPPTWLGLRRDDPNDVIPHEHRRELRAYRVFCAWLHHNDSRQINAADFFVEEEGRTFVKHYLIDFGATLGSRSYEANLRSEGYEYIIDFDAMFTSLATIGLYHRPWMDLQFPEIRGVGRIEAEHFQPHEWKPDYPNPAFCNLTPQDGFWGAKIVMRFSDAQIRAAVEAAEFSDPRATDYLTRILIERRDRVGLYWFGVVNPLDRFRLQQTPEGRTSLRFEDLAVGYGFVEPREYAVELEMPGGKKEERRLQNPELPLDTAEASLRDAAGQGVDERLLRISIRSARTDGSWTPQVQVTLYLQPSGQFRIARIWHDS